ncbi:hypothetical protein Pvag_pPag30230 (plasmid) [Pantoea vagans C9-1]|nr:hypothetical protein Pvag_pPag30230 [Pantoea vagans C9-1]
MRPGPSLMTFLFILNGVNKPRCTDFFNLLLHY